MTEKKETMKRQKKREESTKKEKDNYSFYILKLPPTGFAGSTGIGSNLMIGALDK